MRCLDTKTATQKPHTSTASPACEHCLPCERRRNGIHVQLLFPATGFMISKVIKYQRLSTTIETLLGARCLPIKHISVLFFIAICNVPTMAFFKTSGGDPFPTQRVHLLWNRQSYSVHFPIKMISIARMDTSDAEGDNASVSLLCDMLRSRA